MEVNDAVSEPALIEKFELRADVVWQGALAASHHDRAQEQMALVDQPRADCVASELADRLLRFGEHYRQIARPFDWTFTRADLERVLAKITEREPRLALAA